MTTQSPRIALTTSPLTRQGAEVVAACLRAAGFVVIEFSADGQGGRALEEAVRRDDYHGVVDFTLTELAGERHAGVWRAGPDRLTGAGLRGIPQVVVPGGLDAIAFAGLEQVPLALQGRLTHDYHGLLLV